MIGRASGVAADARASGGLWVAAGVSVLGTALVVGALVSRSPVDALIVVCGVGLIAFGVCVRRAVPMLALGGLAGVAVAYVQATQGGLPSGAKYVSDGVLLVGLVLLARARAQLTPRQVRVALIFVLFMALSAFFGALGNAGLQPAIIGNWQDARWLGAIGLGLLIAGRIEPSQRRRWAFRWLLLISALNVVVSLYQVYAHHYTATRLGFPEVTGLFGQTTANSLAATLLLVFIFVDRLRGPRAVGSGEFWLALAVGMLALLLSTRFKPGLALLAVGAFLILRRLGVRPLALAILGATIPIAIALGLAWFASPGRAQAEQEATANIIAHAAPRVQFMNGAERLAARGFPLGQGSGSYGSDLSPSLEEEAFNAAGLAGQYGFSSRGPQFTSDNFVAHVLGERGYLGLLAWLVSLAALIYFALISDTSNLAPSLAIATVALAPVVPAFRDCAAALLVFVPAALCLSELHARRT